MTTLSNQVHDGAVVCASLDQINGQFGEFTTPKAAAQQDGEEGLIALGFESLGTQRLPKTTSFLRRQPIPKHDPEFRGSLDLTYAGGKLRAQ